VPRVVVGAPLRLAWPHRQQGLGPIERPCSCQGQALDLALFIDAEHHSALGR
jgi:hypothetical protein